MGTTSAPITSERAQRAEAPARVPRVSIIVPARNPGSDLARLLEALQAQTIPVESCEMILADDGSTDGSIEAAAEHDWVHVTPGTPQSSYAARNRAVRAASAPVLAFCDSDCVPEPTWLES